MKGGFTLRETIISKFEELVDYSWNAESAQLEVLDKLILFSQNNRYYISNSFKSAFLEAVNQKLALNTNSFQKVLDIAFHCGFKLNYHLKNELLHLLNLSNFVGYLALLANNGMDNQDMREGFSPVSEERTFFELKKVLETDEKAPEIVSSIFSRYCFNLFDKECTSRFFSGEDFYTSDYYDFLGHFYPDMCKRDYALSVLDVSQDMFDATYTEGINRVLNTIKGSFSNLNNHCDMVVIIPPITNDSKDIQWTIFKDVVLFAEKHVIHPIDRTYFRWEKVRDITSDYIQDLDKYETTFELANEGFVFKDCFVLGGKNFVGSYSLMLIFEKNVRDERPVYCPACRTSNIQGNSYPILNVRSWECENPLCPERSKYNRGKRYAFSSSMRQELMNDSRNLIPQSSIARWHLDCVDNATVYEAIEMCLRHYSCVADGVHIFSNTINEKDFIALERNIEIEDFYGISGDIYSDFYNCCFFKRFIVKNSQATNFIPEYAEVNKAKIYHGDARDVLRSFLESSIDAAVTSPPYYNAKEYSQWPNIYCYLYDMYNIALEVFRVLKPGGVYLFNIFDYFDNEKNVVFSAMGNKRMILGAYMLDIFQKIGFTIVGNIIWNKGEIQGNRSFNQGNLTPYYQAPLNCWEHIFIVSKGTPNPKYKKLGSTIKNIHPVVKMIKGKNTLGHTAPYPIEIPNLIIDCLNEDDIVLDPFLGSGTTCISANAKGISSVGIEKSDEYFMLSQKLISESKPYQQTSFSFE